MLLSWLFDEEFWGRRKRGSERKGWDFGITCSVNVGSWGEFKSWGRGFSMLISNDVGFEIWEVGDKVIDEVRKTNLLVLILKVGEWWR